MARADQPTTMAEGLSRVLADLSACMTTPDADIDFLSKVQGVVVGRMRAGAGPGMMQGAAPGATSVAPGAAQGGPGGAGAPPGALGPPTQPGAGPGMMAGPPTPNGVTSLAQPPNPDELRRMIASHVGGSGS